MSPYDIPAADSVRGELTERWGSPLARVQAKLSPVLHPWLCRFLSLSPYVVMASADGQGRCDASPRGGTPGFVRVLDERTLFIPEESGNRLLQTLHNLQENPGVGLLFLIPGMRETARVNGRAEPVSRNDPRWRDLPLDDEERERLLWGSLIHVEEAYYHCGRASRFSDLWDVDRINRNQADPPLTKRPPTTAPTTAGTEQPVGAEQPVEREQPVQHSRPAHGMADGAPESRAGLPQ